ncbi:MAG: DUF429 domain-containing protein [Imperialibacter sp.]
MLVGIDYGSKLAGTTSICFQLGGEIHFLSSRKGQDADQMILKFGQHHNPQLIFLDAPLSLPDVYRDHCAEHKDYFYRACDRQLSAMSPMFLGGLTARAMRLTRMLLTNQTQVLETYPKWHAHRLGLPDFGYKSGVEHIQKCTEVILSETAITLRREPESWHELDALLALVTAQRFNKGEHSMVGEHEEGLIYL